MVKILENAVGEACGVFRLLKCHTNVIRIEIGFSQERYIASSTANSMSNKTIWA